MVPLTTRPIHGHMTIAVETTLSALSTVAPHQTILSTSSFIDAEHPTADAVQCSRRRGRVMGTMVTMVMGMGMGMEMGMIMTITIIIYYIAISTHPSPIIIIVLFFKE